MNRTTVALISALTLPMGCAGDDDETPTPTPTLTPTSLQVCNKLPHDQVACSPPANLCVLFPPQGSDDPPIYWVEVDDEVFYCDQTYDCYDEAEEACEEGRTPEWIPPHDCTPTPRQNLLEF